MGKTNKAQRTKGNTRPSSSDHSAQLLNLSGRPLSGFIGFNALEKETASYVPVTGQQNTDAVDNSVDSDFRMVMRKMLKRDAVTRLKAMQEFGEYCVEKEKDIVKNVLPYWPRLFNKLALDCDRRIREATHQANGKLLTKVKREMAPYLKNIMGVWLIGQCDLYAPAASAAQLTFLTSFPATKQSEALLFCKTEIFSYFNDNLFEQTVKSMSEPNPSSPEDVENKYILVISGTLRALKLFLATVLPKDHVIIHDDFYSIVAENKFWKYARNNEAQIRGAWYGIVSSICQLRPVIFAEMDNKLATTIFSCLSESDPMVAPAVWESALSIVVNFENCWQDIDIHKIALPQLWSLLKSGGKGNAKVLFPCLLPFLSKLPKEIVESEGFLLKFFNSFKQSLMLDTVKASSLECDAILEAYIECLHFMCCTRLGTVPTGPFLLEKVLVDELLPLFESSLYEQQHSHLATSKFYPLLCSLVTKVENQCLIRNDTISKEFSKVIDCFWENILPIVCKVFNMDAKKKSLPLIYLSYFYNSLLHPFDCLIKKEQRTVHFAGEDEKECHSLKEQPPVHRSVSSETSAPNEKSQSFRHIVIFCKLLCERIDKTPQFGYLRLLEEIFNSISSKQLVTEIVDAFSIIYKYDGSSSIAFCQNVILKWVQQVQGDDDSFRCILNFVFVICSLISEDEAWSVLNCCCQAKAMLLEHVLSIGLERYLEFSFFSNWLSTFSWCSEVIKGLKGFVEGNKFYCDPSAETEIKAYQRILNICLCHNGTKPLIDDSSFEIILQLLENIAECMLSMDSSNKNIDPALNFIHSITIAALKYPQICWKFDATRSLTSCLFGINLHVLLFKNPNKVSQTLFDILDIVIDSYVGVKEEIMSEDSLIYSMTCDISSMVERLNKNQIPHILENCLFLISSVQKAVANHKPELESTFFVLYKYKIMDKILPEDSYWESKTEGISINTFPWFLKKSVFYPMLTYDNFSHPENETLPLILTAYIVSSVLHHEVSCKKEDVKFSMFSQHCINKHLHYLIWCLMLCKSEETKVQVSEESLSQGLEQNCLKLISALPKSEVHLLYNKVLDFACTDYNWTLCLHYLSEMFTKQNFADVSEILLDSESSFEKICLFTDNKNDLTGKQLMLDHVILQILVPYYPIRENMLRVLELCKLEIVRKSETVCAVFSVLSFLLQHELLTEVSSSLKEFLLDIIYYDFEEEDELKEQLHLQLIYILPSIVQYGLNALTPKILDFFTSLLLFVIKESMSKTFSCPSELLFLHHTTVLFSSLARLHAMVAEEHPNCAVEWRPLPLSRDIYMNMILLFTHVADIFSKSKSLPETSNIVLTNLLEAVDYIPAEQLVNILILQHETNVDIEESSSKIESQRTVLHGLISTLTSNVRQLQFASHKLIMKIMSLLPALISDYAIVQVEDDSEEVERLPTKLSPLIDLMSFLNEIMYSMLSDVKSGELCTVVPHTDSYVYAMAYLFAWTEMLEFISSSPPQVRLSYATHLQELKLLPFLFSNIFCFMPDNPMMCLKKGLQVETPKKEDLKLLFIHPPVLKSDVPSSEEVQSIACYVFAIALRKVPASVRTWWNNLDRKSADIVNSFTSKYISGLLCIEEIQAVHESEKQFENMVVQARPGSREVIATYTIDDYAIELCVQLPINYPLGPIYAERRGKVVIGQLEWRHWLMQLTTVLSFQNGSILDGLNIWKRNLDKKFEGVEECMICYYIVDNSTLKLKLPRLSCHVCRKKFHSTCLYTWFRKSNSGTCPLCRNDFAV